MSFAIPPLAQRNRVVGQVMQQPCNEETRLALLTLAQRHYHRMLLSQPSVYLKYLEGRGITAEGIQRVGLGYAPGTFARLLTSRMRAHAQQIGLLTDPGRQESLLHTLIIPECLPGGTCTWMIGWRHTDARYQRLRPSHARPLLGYGAALRRLEEERDGCEAILMVQDALSYVLLTQWQVPFLSVALLGTHMSQHQLDQLERLVRKKGDSPIPMVLGLDADEAGRIATREVMARLASRGYTACVLPWLGVKSVEALGLRPDGAPLLTQKVREVLP